MVIGDFEDFLSHKSDDPETRFKSKEGCPLKFGCFTGQSLCILTSGGDSQGMNAAVKSAARMGIFCGASIYVILEGYQGLVDGGLNIKEVYWSDVSGLVNLGGTMIGSARCNDFKTRKCRLRAAKNLIDRNILNMIIIGGDGSLTGANLFKKEWPSYVKELIERKVIDSSRQKYISKINLVGLVGSIDNDFCGTDMTIGADSALMRIQEATDALVTTAQSHQRCFVIEVMGRHCGFLALITAICSEADFVLIPEKPPPDNWRDVLCHTLEAAKLVGNRVLLVIVSEGAIDRYNKTISATEIRKLISDRLKVDTRITVLGHVQRGGSPSAYDRILGLRQGAEAVLALVDAHNDVNNDQSFVICVNKNVIWRKPLMECVVQTLALQKTMQEGGFDDLTARRSQFFYRAHRIFELLNQSDPHSERLIKSGLLKKLSSGFSNNLTSTCTRIGVICVGQAACGMNAAIRAVVRTILNNNIEAVGIKNGWKGLITQDERFKYIVSLHWYDVKGITSSGGTILGTLSCTPSSVGIEKVAKAIRELHLSGLVIIGGFEGFQSGLELYQNKNKFPEFNIPTVFIPVTIDNNIPGIQLSIGSDTAINVIVNHLDALKIGSSGTQYRIYIVQTMGCNCGYLITMSAFGGGADISYVDEEKLDIEVLSRDVQVLKAKILDQVEYGVVLRSNVTNHAYDSEFIYRLFKQEGQDIFDCRLEQIGNVTLGHRPTPFDRFRGQKYGVEAVLWIVDKIVDKSNNDDNNVVMMGLSDNSDEFYAPIQNEAKNIDQIKSRPLRQWWMHLRSLLRIIQTHESKYHSLLIY